MLTRCYHGLLKKILLFWYLVSFVSIGSLFVMALEELTGIAPKIILLIGMIFALGCTIGWALFSSVLDFSSVAFEFDKIKNDIALKKITEPVQFGSRIVKLLCDFYRFSFFTIRYAFIQIIGTDAVFSHGIINKNIGTSELEQINQNAQKTKEVFYKRAYSIDNATCYLYIVPIWFVGEYLGCIGVFTTRKLNKRFVRFLSDIESLYIDDQLFLILNE